MNKKLKNREHYLKNKDKIIAHNKSYYDVNKEKIKVKRKEYLIQNKEKIADKKREYYEKNKITILSGQKKWREKNNETLKEYYSMKYQNDILFRLKTNIKNLIGNSIRNSGYTKLSKTEQILGCTYDEFKQHLEKHFEPWMNWDNRGLYNGTPNYGWDIDHIIPLKMATCEADIIKLNHYTNLQPLCSYYNRDIKNC